MTAVISSQPTAARFRPLAGPGRGVYTSVAVFLALTLPLSYAWVCDRQLYDLYCERIVAPGVQRDFGFTAARLPTWYGRQVNTPFQVTSITPGGVFAASGFQVGDIFTYGKQHGDHASSLFGNLQAARSQSVELRILRRPGDQDRYLIVGPLSITRK